jgi:hypothetical protein
MYSTNIPPAIEVVVVVLVHFVVIYFFLFHRNCKVLFQTLVSLGQQVWLMSCITHLPRIFLHFLVPIQAPSGNLS